MSTRERDIVTKAAPHTDQPARSERYRKYEDHPLAWADWPENHPSYVTKNGNPTVKWRNISINRIRERAQEIQEAALALRVAERGLHRANEEYCDEVEGLLGIKVTFGTTSCAESPTRTCLYPIHEDGNASLRCLFCETPNEGG